MATEVNTAPMKSSSAAVSPPHSQSRCAGRWLRRDEIIFAMLGDVFSGAFQPFAGLTSLQQAPCGLPSPCNVSLLQTVALKALHRADAEEEQHESSSSHEHSQTLSDGRLNVGTHLPLMAKRYAYLSLIGEGTSAQVVLAEDTLQPSRPLVAIKIMKRQHTYTGQKEMRALRYLHAHGPASMSAVKLLGSFMHAGHLCLVLERLHASLLDYLSHSSTLPSAVQLRNLRQIAFQLLGSMAVVHAHGVVHADLKPENILLREPLQEGSPACPEVLITDFGSAFSTSETDTAKVAFEMQTLPYRAPEVLAGAGLTDGAAVDAWSLGCILAELVLKRPLFPCNSPSQLLAQMENMLRTPSSAALSGSGAVHQESASRHLEEDDELIARMASSSAAHPTIPSWQSNLSLLASELVKVDQALADLILKLLCWDPAKRLSTIDALLHPFFDALSPVRHLLQVAPLGTSSASMQHLKQLGLQSLIQQVRAASRPASRLPSRSRDSRASPAPSCPTPISQRDAGKQMFEGSQRTQDLLRGSVPKQATSAPLLLAPAVAESPPSLKDMLLVQELRANSALGSSGAALLPAQSEQGLQQASSNQAGPASAQAAAAQAPGSSHHAPCSDSLATRSAGVVGALHAEAQPPLESSLYSLEQPLDGSKQAPAAPKEPAGSVHSPGSRGRAGRNGRLSAAQALFPEIRSRLPPVSFAMAGYTDMYDFPEGALAVADSFLRDAPSLERPERPAMPAEDAANMQSPPGAVETGAHPAVILHRSRDPSASTAGGATHPGAFDVLAPEALAETGAAAGASPPEGPPSQRAAASRPAAVAQETEQRSCRSSGTPHKTGTRDTHADGDSLRLQQQCEHSQRGMQSRPEQASIHGDDCRAPDTKAGSSDSSQAAHESQAGVTIPIRSADATTTAQQGGTSGEDEYGRSPGTSAVVREMSARRDLDSKQQPQISNPNSGLDVLAAAASAVGAVPNGRAGRGRGQPVAGVAARNTVAVRTRKAPEQAVKAGATPGRKRKALKEADPSFSPEKEQRPGSAAVVSSPSKATPSRRKPGRPKTPSKAGSRPASAASPVRNGAKKGQGASTVSTQPYNGSLANPVLRPLGSPSTGKERTISSIYRTPGRAAQRLAAVLSRDTPQLRDRASIAEKGAKPWWVV